MKRLVAAGMTVVLTGPWLLAQGGRPASPAGTSATQVGGKYTNPAGADEPVYSGGKWIEVTYGRPIKRGRDLWGSGADYGKKLYAGAPVWRAGANVTTRLKTEVPLVINNKSVAPGEYSLFIDLKPSQWTLIVSSWPAQAKFDPQDKTALWGAYGYTPDKDVARIPMKVDTLPFAVEELTWSFVDMMDDGGAMAISWGTQMASVPFKIQ